MDFGRYNQAEQAQIAQMIEHKQVDASFGVLHAIQKATLS